MSAEIQFKTLFSQIHVKQQSILGIEQWAGLVLPETRVRRKKRGFDYECADNYSSPPPVEETFKWLFFLVLTDQTIIIFCLPRFDQLVDWYKLFAQHWQPGAVSQRKSKFRNKQKDFDANEPMMELDCFIYNDIETETGFWRRTIFKLDYIIEYIIDYLQEIHVYPNLCICVRIPLTTSTAIAGAERSFRRMKLVKNILCSTMPDDRLSALTVIAVANKISVWAIHVVVTQWLTNLKRTRLEEGMLRT